MKIITNNMPRLMKYGRSFGMNGWHGYASDSAWSGVLVKYLDDDHVIVGRYYS